MFGVAGGVGLAVVHAFEGRLAVVLDFVHFFLVAVVVLGLAGVALVLVVFVRHGGSVSQRPAPKTREVSKPVHR
ncbi:hypothetical protein E5E91_01915 [Deinococcus radiodurans R1 = ATCC 13939 = DSM 20539]|uniref:Uncharacterized protein n=1 Tax=Deinococcus radiodurans (strain ATCC 13939 / DSM 20539 / JCM 16871 / CCUG 27074 / LMG 4051 / NBRC 15346 / NCIMB 9279 / VKM B-1422 / R1) TaxID=243230 RepID=Q9RXE2_DEIRA|nr:hypothetical protein DR_0371 [Deinococcus radiodurans R1 = ATCC 13939 = DSM 20539]QEM72326.1 hypothetical protein DXG80_11510 [Deinococcus radiodurans]UDK99560.1 hypothetical protein E5E91_01915 [Deinococcus radiodurans R1 = ATCC 13939 = DSM 20539]HCE65392.1 hypothetical protein [Deinococcus radiodurans]